MPEMAMAGVTFSAIFPVALVTRVLLFVFSLDSFPGMYVGLLKATPEDEAPRDELPEREISSGVMSAYLRFPALMDEYDDGPGLSAGTPIELPTSLPLPLPIPLPMVVIGSPAAPISITRGPEVGRVEDAAEGGMR